MASTSMPALMPAFVRLNLSCDSLQSTGHDRQAENEQQVAENAAGDRRLHQVDEASLQRHDRDDELGGVAEGGVEQATERRAGAGGDLFGCLAHEPGEGEHAETGGDENEDRCGVRCS